MATLAEIKLSFKKRHAWSIYISDSTRLRIINLATLSDKTIAEYLEDLIGDEWEKIL